MGTLYGTRQVAFWRTETTAAWTDCLYAVPSGIFEEYPVLDGAIVSAEDGIVLCPNEFSPRHQSFQHTRAFRFFQDRGVGLFIPEEAEAKLNYFRIADRDSLDRNSLDETQAYLIRRYNLLGILMICDAKTTFATSQLRELNSSPD